MDSKNISIHLDKPRRLWHPGDIVSGKVKLVTTEQVDVEKVDIRFEGRSKVKVTRRQNRGQAGSTTKTYRSRIYIFVFGSTLFSGPFTLKPGTMEWSFAFEIPEQCRNTSGAFGSDVLRYSPGFALDRSSSLALPPTMSSTDTSFLSSGHKMCHVSYGLLVKLHVANTFSTNREQFLALNLQPYREQVAPDIVYSEIIRRISIQTLHLNPDIGERSLTFKERWKSTFSSAEVPVSCFSILVELPRIGIAGVPSKATLRLAYNHKESTAPEIPQVLLTDATYAIRERVAVVVKAYHLFGETDDGYSWSSKRTFCEWRGRKAFKKCDDGNLVFVQDLRAPATSPSFGTLNINYSYTLEAKFAVECAGKRESFEAQIPFVCLPTDFRESALENARVLEASSDAAAAGGGEGAGGEEQLPPYSKT